MFDIGFSEIFLFGVIALIVLGPEKLPQAARTAGQWYAKLRRTVSTIQSEIEAELDLAETRQKMQDELAKIRQTEADMKREMAEMRGSMRDFKNSQEDSFKPTNNLNPNPSASTQQASSGENSNQKNQSSPSEFAYAYHHDQAIQTNNQSKPLATDTDPVSSDHTADTETQTNAPAPLIMTRPWENMWFRLGAYDRARRLPAAPYLPNYKADTLLYNHSLENASVAQQQAKP